MNDDGQQSVNQGKPSGANEAQMAGQQDETTQQQPSTEPPPGNAAPPEPIPPPIVPPAQSATTNGDATNGDGKVVQVPTADFKKIKDEAKEKGRREALTDLDAMATKLGFANLEGALSALADLKKSTTAPTTTEPKPTETNTMATAPKKKTDDRTADKAAREAQRLADERAKIRKDWKATERKNRDLKRQLDAKEAEKGLIIEMTRFGVTDIDYAQRLLMRELQGKSTEEVAKFDRKVFFEKLRSDKPFLFSEKVVPATTGTNGTQPDGSAPVVQPPAATVVQTAASQQFDARKATRQEYEDHLRKLGLNPNM